VTLVIGFGNELRGDDAAGLAVVRALDGSGIRLRAHEGEPSGLLNDWEGEPEVILVDAVRSSAPPGTVMHIDVHEDVLPAELFRVSTHHFTVADAVELGRTLGRLPEQLEIYAIAGRDFDPGDPLGPEVKAAVRRVADELLSRLPRDRRMAPGGGARPGSEPPMRRGS
jgi:hydrogenase maturation protease